MPSQKKLKVIEKDDYLLEISEERQKEIDKRLADKNIVTGKEAMDAFFKKLDENKRREKQLKKEKRKE